MWKSIFLLAQECKCPALNTIVHNILPNMLEKQRCNVKTKKIQQKVVPIFGEPYQFRLVAHFKIISPVYFHEMNILLASECECLALSTIAHSLQPKVLELQTYNVITIQIRFKIGSTVYERGKKTKKTWEIYHFNIVT